MPASTVLFLGQPWDGLRQSLEDSVSTITVRVLHDGLPVEEGKYVRLTLAGVHFFVREGRSGAWAAQWLHDNYRRVE